ncbi:DUF3857 domain-containing protein [Ferruginibacter sp.]
MKSAIVLLSLSFFLSLNSNAQKTPAFGKVEKADLEMKDCDFDNAAEALVLFDVGEVYCDLNLNNAYAPVSTQLERHVRIKILNTKGTKAADIHIRYLSYKNAEDIKNLSAETINLDAGGNIVFTKVEKDAIFHKQINKRYSEVIFTFPDVKPGSIIEYKYKDVAMDLYGLKNWYFQRSIPVAFSSYTMDFPKELIVSATPKGGLDVRENESYRGNRSVKTYTMQKVPALRDEAFITCDDDYLQQLSPQMMAVDFDGMPRKSLLRTWPGIIRQLMEDEDFGLQIKKNIPRTSDLDALLANKKDAFEKMSIIHEYVKKNMQWDETNGIWALDGVKAAWKNKKGTAGEINLILVNLLRDADLDAHPVLVSTRDNGMINTRVAGFDQFNKVMAYVTIDSSYYVLDATDKYTPSYLVPFSVVNSEGLVINKIDTYDWGWRVLWNEDQLFDNSTIMEATIDDKGTIKGIANVTSVDYSRFIRLDKLKEGKQKFTEAWLNPMKQNITIDSLNIINENDNSLPLVQEFNFEKKVNASGDYNYFSINLFSGLERNPFVADERFSDVFFGANQSYTITANVTIPKGYTFDALPKNLKMIMPDTSIVFTRNSSISNDTLSSRIVLEFRQPYYMNQQYGYFKEFYKKLFDFLNEQFVYKKS